MTIGSPSIDTLSSDTLTDRHTTKRGLDDSELPLWMRRPPVEPRVEPPRTSLQRRLTMKAPKTQDPLDALGLKAARTKEQIDALEKMLRTAMPPRIVLDNTFTGLRNSVADELQSAMEIQWQSGVEHGERIAKQRINELEARLAPCWFQQWHNGGPVPDSPAPDSPDLLALFLEDEPVPHVTATLDFNTDSPRSVIDLDALSQQVDALVA